jgi:hypothetical protein
MSRNHPLPEKCWSGQRAPNSRPSAAAQPNTSLTIPHTAARTPPLDHAFQLAGGEVFPSHVGFTSYCAKSYDAKMTRSAEAGAGKNQEASSRL